MDIYEIVRKLVGDIEPIGETNSDNFRFENLKVMTKLVNKLIADISYVAENKNRQEYSVQRAGEFADTFLNNWGIKE